MSPPVLTEDTLKEIEDFLEEATPEKWEQDLCNVSKQVDGKSGRHILCGFGDNRYSNVALVCTLRNNAAELLRGYRLGITLDKDRKP